MIPNTANANLEGDDPLDIELAMATRPVDASGAIPSTGSGQDLVDSLANIADNTELIHVAVLRVEASLEAVLKILKTES